MTSPIDDFMNEVDGKEYYDTPLKYPEKPEVIPHEKKQQVSKYGSEEKKKEKEIKKERIKEFNKKPETKDYGVKLISKKTINVFWIVIGVLICLLMVNLIWDNSVENKLANIIKDKDFGSTNNINVEPSNVTVPVEVNDQDTINNKYNHTIINNITIINVVGNSS